MSSQQLFTASEAARALGISLDTLRRWDRAGRIRTERDKANRRLVPASEVTRLKGRSDAGGAERAQPLPRRRARGRDRGLPGARRARRDGAGARGRRHHPRGRRGARPAAGARGRRDRQVDVGDGRAVIGRRLFTAWLVAATLLALVFLMLPLVAIFLRVPPGDLIAQLGSDVAIDAIVVTLKTTLISQALILIVGTPAAYLIASRTFRGRAFAITLVELPLVLPPAVAGIALLAAFGRLGLLGSSIEAAGHLRQPRDADRRRARDRLRREPLLRPPGHRLVRGARHSPCSTPRAPSARARPARSSASPSRSQSRGSRPGLRSPSPAASVSSARRSCSPAASRA